MCAASGARVKNTLEDEHMPYKEKNVRRPRRFLLVMHDDVVLQSVAQPSRSDGARHALPARARGQWDAVPIVCAYAVTGVVRYAVAAIGLWFAAQRGAHALSLVCAAVTSASIVRGGVPSTSSQ